MKQLPKLFSFNDLKDTYKTASDFSVFVYRAMKRGDIKQVKRGLYALVNPSTGVIFATKFQIASHLFDDAYFSYHDALEYYGLANQSFVSIFTYLTKSHARDLEFEDVTYKAKKSNSGLFIRDRMKEEGIRVVSLERAIIDSIDCLSLAGGLEEAEYALDNCPKLNIKDVETLLKAYGKSVLYQKVGYLFEKHFGNDVPEEFYKECLKHSGNTVIYLECNPGRGKLNAKWKLMIKKKRDLPNELF
jgi:predicted transcriptional regulator of viral defense system